MKEFGINWALIFALTFVSLFVLLFIYLEFTHYISDRNKTDICMEKGYPKPISFFNSNYQTIGEELNCCQLITVLENNVWVEKNICEAVKVK